LSASPCLHLSTGTSSRLTSYPQDLPSAADFDVDLRNGHAFGSGRDIIEVELNRSLVEHAGELVSELGHGAAKLHDRDHLHDLVLHPVSAELLEPLVMVLEVVGIWVLLAEGSAHFAAAAREGPGRLPACRGCNNEFAGVARRVLLVVSSSWGEGLWPLAPSSSLGRRRARGKSSAAKCLLGIDRLPG